MEEKEVKEEPAQPQESSQPIIEQIEIIPQSTQSKSKGSGTNYDKRKIYTKQYFDQRYNQQQYHHNYNPIHFGQNQSHNHRTNSASYYHRSVNKKGSLELSRNALYGPYQKKKKVEEHGLGKINQVLKGKNHIQLFFIHPYEKCSDFNGFSNFLTLNLKFLKQNYKMKSSENEEESNMNFNSRKYTQTSNPMSYMMNMLSQNNSQNGNVNKVMNMQNQNNMMGVQAMIYNNLLSNYSNSYKNMLMKTNNSQANNPMAMQYFKAMQMQQMQQQIHSNSGGSTATESDNSDPNIQNNLSIQNGDSFVHPYTPILTLSKAKPFQYTNMNFNMQPINTNKHMNFNQNNNLQYQNEDYQYSFVTDQKQIEENKKTGKFLTGIIRMNKCHTHGYITVPGLENDILIRGNRNLNQSINLDEVIVELFPIKMWKPLVNKKMRKISYINEENNNNNQTEGNTATNGNNDCNTDVETEEKGDLDTNDYDENFKENFQTKEERLKYINKLFNLRPEGRIVKILKSPNTEKEQIARIETDKNLVFACPIDELLPKIFIKNKKQQRKDFKKNETDPYKNKYFLIKLSGWAMSYKCPKGTIVNEIGLCGNIEVESEVLLRQYNVDYNETFQPSILENLKKKIEESKIDEEFIKKNERVDLRNELIFTVDPYTSKDLDDAISVKEIDKEKGLLEIGVHIADPSYYVTKDSELDKEACRRGTTVYLVQKNIPMLPRILSEDLCSLMPNKDRLAVSCTFRICMNTGALDESFKPKFYLSVINSKAKWNYDLVQDIIDGKDIVYDEMNTTDGTKPQSVEILNELIKSVHLLHKLTSLVRKQRFESGSLMIKNDNIHFTLDEKTHLPLSFSLDIKHDSHHLIEELMLIANKLCAEHIFTKMRKYALIRRHPYLNDNKFSEIQRYLISNKISVDYEDPQELNKMLMEMEKTNQNKFLCIQHKLKTFMLRAEYVIANNFDQEELKHCALNFELYTHFTSPIRRYPDIIVHRELKDILMNFNEAQYEEDFKGYEGLMDHFNEAYNNSKQISQKSQRIFQCIYLKQYLKDNPDKKFEGLIMDINGKSNKRVSMNDINVCLFIPEINLELEWRKDDNDNIINIRFDKSDNELSIDYKTEQNKVGNKVLKTFDSINLTLSCVESIPIDVKSSFELI